MRLKLISCEVFYREFCAALARSPNTVDVEFVSRGVHDLGGASMRQRLQEMIDQTDPSQSEALLLGYGLCNNGLVGLRARSIPLVVPRAHDCIAIFLGSKERYLEYFHTHPGVYFQTTGWMERAKPGAGPSQLTLGQETVLDLSLEQLVAKYGEDNAQYLWEQLGQASQRYGQFTFIEMGVEPNGSFESQVRQKAAERGWKFEKIAGDLGLIQRLVDGIWRDEEFLVVPPGFQIVARYDKNIIAAEAAAG